MPRAATAKTLIGIQETLIDTINRGHQRWSHRKDLGHFNRIRGGAINAAQKDLTKIGFKDAKQIAMIVKDALDMAVLERITEDPEDAE